MIFRTESFSAGALDAPAATIVKVVAKAMAMARARLFGKNSGRATDVLTLSGHELRDVGLERVSPGTPIAYDLLDLLPRRKHLGHRMPRWL